MRRKRRPWLGFVPFVVLAVLGIVVLDGVASGVVSFAAMLAFVVACINALRGADADADRTGLAGWVGNWF